MNNSFQYTVLKYRHSLLLNEVVNVGLLFYFQSERIIQFICPNKLNRISHLYNNIDINNIKTIQNIFSIRCGELNKRWKYPIGGALLDYNSSEQSKFSDIITEHFLVNDSSSLYFDEIRSGSNIGIDYIIRHYKREYFSCYDEVVTYNHRKDEKYLEQRLKTALKASISNIHRIEVNKEVSVGLITERFKWGWKNGTENLIAPIGFDLLEAETIKQKALSWYGKLSLLKEFAINNNISFHIITSNPTNKQLYKEYEKALKVLDKANAPTKIIEEPKILDYSEYILNNISNGTTSKEESN